MATDSAQHDSLPHLFLPTLTTWLACPGRILVLLLTGLCLLSPAVADDLILGRIEVRLNGVESKDVAGPLGLEGDAAAIFREYWQREEIEQGDLAPHHVAALLTHHHLVLSKVQSPERTFPAQWEPLPAEDGASLSRGRIVWLFDDGGEGALDGEYQLRLRDGESKSPFAVDYRDDRAIVVSNAGQRVLQYNHDVVRQQPNQSGPYDRACYLHPIWTPSGAIVTGDFSPEHIHQRGVFTAWVKARFGNIESDFWSLGDSQGCVLPAGRPPQWTTGPVFAQLRLANQGVVDGVPVFDEQITVTVYAGKSANGWLIDLHTEQSPVAGGQPMELPKIYYGGTSFRGPANWLRESSRDVRRAMERGVSFEDALWLDPDVELDVLTSAGDDRTHGDRTTIRWIDYTGPLGDSWGGLAMYDHPSNLRYPTPVRIHPELPYFSLALVQQESLTVESGQPLRLMYRLRVHDGHPDARTNERVAESFSMLPDLVWRPRN